MFAYIFTEVYDVFYYFLRLAVVLINLLWRFVTSNIVFKSHIEAPQYMIVIIKMAVVWQASNGVSHSLLQKLFTAKLQGN